MLMEVHPNDEVANDWDDFKVSEVQFASSHSTAAQSGDACSCL